MTTKEQKLRDRIIWHEGQAYKLKEQLLALLKKQGGSEQEILRLSMETNPMGWD